MCRAGRWWKEGQIKVDLVSRRHDGVVGEGDTERWVGRALVGVGCLDGEEVAGGTGI